MSFKMADEIWKNLAIKTDIDFHVCNHFKLINQGQLCLISIEVVKNVSGGSILLWFNMIQFAEDKSILKIRYPR